jgi:hypothetical protein
MALEYGPSNGVVNKIDEEVYITFQRDIPHMI